MYFHFNLVPCEAPLLKNVTIVGVGSVNISWKHKECVIGSSSIYIYLFYLSKSEEESHKKWNYAGVNSSNNHIILQDLPPGDFRGYLLQGTADGNGPPSPTFYFKTPPLRKLSIVDSCLKKPPFKNFCQLAHQL